MVETLSSSAYYSRWCFLCSPKATAPTLNWLGTTPLNIAYTLNATGNRTARAESFAGTSRREAYGYDAIDQLIESRLNPVGTANERRVGYVYDAAGNRTRVVEDADGTGPGAAQACVYRANALNQYTAISGLAAPLHDIDGNTTLLQSGARLWSYQYDAQNRLVSGTDGTTTFQFHYDARNRCVSRVINGESRYLTYDGWSLLEDRDNAGRLTAKHLHGGSVDEVLATVTSGGARYLHQDGLGNVVALTDGSGSVLERVRYDAYGQPEHLTAAGAVVAASPTGNRFLFTGREWFPELGLQDNRHRYYHPGVGRWLSRDPLEEEGGLNLYGYVGNSPTALLDPMGLCCEIELKAWQDSIDDYRIKLKEHDQALKAIILQNKVVQLARVSFAGAVGLEYSEFLNVLKNCVGNSYRTSCRNATKRWFAAMAAADVDRRVLSNEKEDLEMKKVEARDKKTASSRAEALVDKSKDSYIKCMFP